MNLGIVTDTVIISCFSSAFNILLTIIMTIAFYITLTYKDQDEFPFIINLKWERVMLGSATHYGDDTDMNDIIGVNDPYQKLGHRRKLSLELINLGNIHDPFEFEVLSSVRRGRNSAVIYGVLKIDKSCQDKQRKMSVCLQKHRKLQQAVLNAFEYEPDYTSMYNFEIEIKTGNTKNIKISSMMQKYLPQIWDDIDWNEIQSQNAGITKSIIHQLTNEITKLNEANDNDKNEIDDEEYKEDENGILYITQTGDESLEIEMMKQVDLNLYID